MTVLLYPHLKLINALDRATVTNEMQRSSTDTLVTSYTEMVEMMKMLNTSTETRCVEDVFPGLVLQEQKWKRQSALLLIEMCQNSIIGLRRFRSFI